MMPGRIVHWANQHAFISVLAMTTVVVVGGLIAVNLESAQRAEDLRREQAEDARVLAQEQAARDQAVIRICQTMAARVELTFHETYAALAARAKDTGRPAPAVYNELDLIAEKNLDPAFCSPPALEESPNP